MSAVNEMNEKSSDILSNAPLNQNHMLEISCNWKITNNRNFYNAVTTLPLQQKLESINLDEVVSFDTCISLQPSNDEIGPCILDIKVKSPYKIARISVVSEANVLEFFKESGEYATTVFSQFIDEFEENFVYIADTVINPYSKEASIKFTKSKNKGPTMWVYGIKIFLIESTLQTKPDSFNYDVIKSLFTQQEITAKQEKFDILKALGTLNIEENTHLNNITTKKNNGNTPIFTKTSDIDINNFDMKIYIDNKFEDLERRLTQKIDNIEIEISKKLDTIINKLQLH